MNFLEPENEEEIRNNNCEISKFRTCDNDNKDFYPEKKLDDNYCIKSFDYTKGKKNKAKSRKSSRDKSPRMCMNAKNVQSNYKLQAEKFSAKAQHKAGNGSVYTQRDLSPNMSQDYYIAKEKKHKKMSSISLNSCGNYVKKIPNKHKKNDILVNSYCQPWIEESLTSRVRVNKEYADQSQFQSNYGENAYVIKNNKNEHKPKHRKSKSNYTSRGQKENYKACDGSNKFVPPNYSTLYKNQNKNINYHDLLQKMISERQARNNY